MARKKIDLKTLKDTPPWDWPKDTGKMLLEVLRDERTGEEDRLLAVDLAGDFTVVNDKLAEVLVAYVGDDKRSEEMRAQAALSLGPALEHADLMGFDDPDDITITERMLGKIQDKLRELYAKTGLPKLLRRRLLEASVRAPQDWHQDAVRAAYTNGDREWRLTAVFCMRHVRGFEAQILESLDDADPAIRCEAILAASEWAIEAAWPQVSALVKSKKTDKPLLVAAIEAVASIRPAEAPALLEHLADSDDEDIASAVAEALDVVDAGEDDDDESWLDDDDDDLDGEGDDDDSDDEDSGPNPKLLN
jgi:hypothetical protein